MAMESIIKFYKKRKLGVISTMEDGIREMKTLGKNLENRIIQVEEEIFIFLFSDS